VNDSLLAVIKQIVAEQGDAILSDPRRVSAFLADLARDIPKPQKTAFVKCLEHQSAQTLKNAGEPDRALCKQRLAQWLHEEEGLDLALCGETLDLLAAALFGEGQKKALCAKCGKELQEGWKTCPYCSTPTAQEPPAKARCAKCGKELQEGWKTCPHCSSPAVSSGTGGGRRGFPPISGLRLIRTFEGFGESGGGGVDSVSFSPDGAYVVSASAAGKNLRLWGTENGRLIRTFGRDEDVVWSVAFSPDGAYVVSGSYDKTLKLWETESGRLIRTVGHESNVNSVAFSPDGAYVVSGAEDSTIKLWETASGRLIRTQVGHERWDE
jgi:RNA polymerase subunit RPABC4/transcription elongation factor Spt4